MEAVRQGKWKLRLARHARTDLQPREPVTPELFDLEVDPSERYNIADRQPEVVKRLSKKLKAFAEEIKAKVAK